MATIIIGFGFGEGGIFQRAQTAKELYTNSESSELDFLDDAMQHIDEQLEKAREKGRDNSRTSPDTPVEPEIEYTDVYVTLYTDGTLGFASTESKIANKTPKEGKSWNITGQAYSGEWHEKWNDEEEKYNYYTTATTPWLEDRGQIKTVIFTDEIVPKSVTAWFMGCTELSSIEMMENLNTTNVSNFSGLFCDCIKLSSIDVSSLETKNVTNMSRNV